MDTLRRGLRVAAGKRAGKSGAGAADKHLTPRDIFCLNRLQFLSKHIRTRKNRTNLDGYVSKHILF